MKIPEFIKAMFSAKPSNPPPPTTSDFVEELVAIGCGQQDARVEAARFPWIRWKCPKCEMDWFCYGYSREFVPVYCTYCGVRFEMPPEDELKAAKFRDERGHMNES